MHPTIADRIKQRLAKFTIALEEGETIQDKFTCRRIELHLKPTPYDPKAVRQTRKALGASQAVFAILLGTSIKTVQAWEQGTGEPSKMASRFMDEIRRNPEYWIERLQESIVKK
jgi:putative transcriptional regulator